MTAADDFGLVCDADEVLRDLFVECPHCTRLVGKSKLFILGPEHPLWEKVTCPVMCLDCLQSYGRPQ